MGRRRSWTGEETARRLCTDALLYVRSGSMSRDDGVKWLDRGSQAKCQSSTESVVGLVGVL